MEWFLSRVDPYVGFHISLCVESFVADLADKRFNPAVYHLEVFGQAKPIGKPLPTLLADVDPTIAVHPAMAFKTLGVWEALGAERARERTASIMETDMALKGSTTAEDATALPTLILKQTPTND